jgi:general secretion pathway protein N
MPSFIRWLAPLLALIALLIGLVIHAPAATLYAWFAPEPSAVEVRNLSGTLYQGRAAAVLQQGQLRAENLAWTLQPGALLGARLSYALSGQALGGPFTARLGATPTGRVHAAPLLASGDINRLLVSIGQGFLPLAGQWRLELERLVIKDQWPEELVGVATVQNASWTLMRDPLVIGDFEALLSTEADPAGGPPTLLATVRSLRGALEVEGTARQFADRRQRADLRVRPAADAPPMVANLLRGIGRPDAQGWYRIQQDGRLP